MKELKKATEEECPFNGCPIEYTLSIVGGKWKWAILSLIAQDKIIRYGQVKENLPKIAHRTLSHQLKELEKSNIIHRKQYNQVPPKVEYSLTDRGKSLIPILDLMSQWGISNREG
ncbi:putative HTH-type transcriptional regulator YybR [Sporomusa rhizae]|uniref:winged helix-turn-helix transcriptional regulator n=1 Tax=Sporomusa rhizae TaxID=357999 RepID=UPI00352A8C36